MTSIMMYRVLVDWLTVTSYRDALADVGTMIMESVGNEWTESKVMQYDGKRMDLEAGHIFVGTGIQKQARHHMIRISGQSSHDALPWVARSFFPFQDRLTRIDAQITIHEPKDWSQWNLLTRLRATGNHVGWVASRDKETGYELATVYIGNRKSSPRFTRIYQKLTDEKEKLLRLEVEIKRNRAREHGKLLHEYADGNLRHLRDELAFISQKDSRLELAFAEALQGYKKPIRVGAQETNTGAWIMNQCLPAMDKHLGSHSSNQTAAIISTMKEIIRRNEI